jgi:putative DNA primase/helicase
VTFRGDLHSITDDTAPGQFDDPRNGSLSRCLPPELIARVRWLAWKRELPADRKPTKVPYRIDGRRADVTKPAHWDTFGNTVRGVSRIGAAGVGFVVGDGFIGVDLDHVRDVASGAVKAWARDVIARLDSFTELSPSGTGFHIFIRGTKPAGRCNIRFAAGEAFEIYDHARFLTVTGAHVAGTPLAVRAVPDDVLAGVVDAMLAKLPAKPKPPPAIAARGPANPVNLDDDELLRRMFAGRNGDANARLYHGDCSAYGSQSDADLRLCGLLAFWTGRDPRQMDRLFRASGLMREKWDTRRRDSTYGADTIARACANCTTTYSGGSANG